MMLPTKLLLNTLSAVTAAVVVGARVVPASGEPGPVLAAAASWVAPKSHVTAEESGTSVASRTTAAVRAFAKAVRPLSHPKALETAFRGYFAFKEAHPAEVRKPYLYFVDLGLDNRTPRGYVFDMEKMTVVDGPFMVSHGNGSASG